MYYMKYETTITSKGTITIASPLRKALNLMPGRKVKLSLDGNKRLLIDPGTTMEEFEVAREQLLREIPKHKLKLKGQELKNAVEKAKIAESKKKYLK